jgi:hypothetical protein
MDAKIVNPFTVQKYAAMSAVELRKAAQGKIPNAKKHRKMELIELLAEWDRKAEAAFAADEAARVAREAADDANRDERTNLAGTKKATKTNRTGRKATTRTKTQAKPAPVATDHETRRADGVENRKAFKKAVTEAAGAKKVGPTRFSAGTKSQQAAKSAPKRSGRKMCQICAKRPVDTKTAGRDSTMCEPCYEYAGWENTHSDDGHEGTAPIDPDDLAAWEAEKANCPVCQGNDPANKPARKNGSKPGRSVTKPMTTESKSFDAKAKAFAAVAKAAGWSAKIHKISANSAQVIATSHGETISMVWDHGAYQYDVSEHKDADGHKAKIRNASAARKMLEA